MPDMTQAKNVVKRRYRFVKRLIIFELAFWAICVAAVAIASADDIGWDLLLFALAHLGALAVPYIVILGTFKQWRAARRDLKNNRLLQKETKLTVVQYQSGYRGSFSAHLVDRDCERYVLDVDRGTAIALSSWLSNIPATIEYLEDSRIATTVYLEISPHAMMPSALASLFEEREGYTRFIKGKKKEKT